MSLLTPIYTAVNALGVLLTRLTADRAAAIDKLDANISTRAPAASALSTATWTNTRAGKLDQLDATVTSRASADTALSSATWTNTRAGKLDQLDQLDAAVSSRMAGIKGIQRGVLQIYSGDSTYTTTITAVNPAKTELRLLGFYLASTDSTNNQLVALQLTNATTLTATRGSTTGGACFVSWELTEYL